jgi:hypothetical protein
LSHLQHSGGGGGEKNGGGDGGGEARSFFGKVGDNFGKGTIDIVLILPQNLAKLAKI